jgi:hypothetical protein
VSAAARRPAISKPVDQRLRATKANRWGLEGQRSAKPIFQPNPAAIRTECEAIEAGWSENERRHGAIANDALAPWRRRKRSALST